MSETPPAGVTPPESPETEALEPGGSPEYVRAPADPDRVAAPDRSTEGRRVEMEAPRPRRLPAGWGAWLLVLGVGIAHLAIAVQSVNAGVLVAAIGDLRGQDLFAWIETLLALFVRPDAAWDTSRMLALWMLVLMITSIYTSLRAGLSLPHGVLSFVGYALTSAIILGVATPAAWYVFGSSGPVAATFVPPLAMTAVAALSLRSAES